MSSKVSRIITFIAKNFTLWSWCSADDRNENIIPMILVKVGPCSAVLLYSGKALNYRELGDRRGGGRNAGASSNPSLLQQHDDAAANSVIMLLCSSAAVSMGFWKTENWRNRGRWYRQTRKLSPSEDLKALAIMRRASSYQIAQKHLNAAATTVKVFAGIRVRAEPEVTFPIAFCIYSSFSSWLNNIDSWKRLCYLWIKLVVRRRSITSSRRHLCSSAVFNRLTHIIHALTRIEDDAHMSFNPAFISPTTINRP